MEVEPQVFDLLAYLIENRERVVTQDDLLKGVWQGRIVSESTLRSRLTAARAAVGDDGEQQRLIRTLPRKGVRFVGEVREEAEVSEPTTALAEQPPASEAAPAAPAQGPALPRKLAGHPVSLVLATVAAVAVVGAGTLTWYRHSGSSQNADQKQAAGEVPFDPSRVPLVNEDIRKLLANYPQEPDFKAVAISREGYGVALRAGDVESAKREALDRCKERDAKGICRIYAVGNMVVWSSPYFPLPLDVRREPLDTPLTLDDGRLLGGTGRAIEAYLKEKDHKAFAFGPGGVSWASNRSSRAEAIRLAVERCSDVVQSPCLLIGVDGFSTHRFPRSRRIIGLFTLTGETGIAPADKQRITQIYGGKEWRAVARGEHGSGRFHPVTDAPSEAAAVEAALKACAQADSNCRLYAIGNFRVADESQ